MARTLCSLVGMDAAGVVVLRRRVRRQNVVSFVIKLPACTVAMEACCGAHHLGRALADQGYSVRLISPEYVRPYVKAQKNDDRDAEAIAEAASRTDNAIRKSQDGGAIGSADFAPRQRTSREHQNPSHQSDAGDTSRARARLSKGAGESLKLASMPFLTKVWQLSPNE